jgi:hypothetical protein
MSNTAFSSKIASRRRAAALLGASLLAGAVAPGAHAQTSAPLGPIPGVTVAGVVTGPNAVPRANTRVLIVSKSSLAALVVNVGTGAGPINSGGVRDTVTNARGEYAFTGVARGQYFVGPLAEGVIFRVPGTSVITPVDLNLTATTGTFALSFAQAGIDSSNPVITVTDVKTAAPRAVTGMLVDPVSGSPRTSSGVLGVAAALYRGSGLTREVYNFNKSAFEKPVAAPGGTNPLLNPNYYRVAAVSAATSIPAGTTGLTRGVPFTPAGASFPTEIRSNFSIALPTNLANGAYQLVLGGLDGSLRRAALVTRDFTIGTVTPPPSGSDTTAPVVTTLTVGGKSVAASNASTPVSVPTLKPIAGNASDAGGVAKVRLHIARNFRREGMEYKGEFWDGTDFVPGTITINTVISSLPSVEATVPNPGGSSVTWSYTTDKSVFGTPGNYGILSVAIDKADNQSKPTVVTFGDLAAFLNSVRTVTVGSIQPT